MKRLLKILFLFLILNFFLVPQAKAADLNIDCPASSAACSKSGLDPLFSNGLDGFWYPGKSITKTLSLKNSGPEMREMAIRGTRTSTPNILENVMNISIVGGTTVIWNGLVADFYGQDKIGMGIFAPGANLDYNFTVFMSSDADDNYQNRETVFDLTLGFWGEPIPTPTPTPGVVLGTGVSAPTCDVAKPGSPTNFLVSNSGAGAVTLSWGAPPLPYTYFLIAYSNDSTTMKWGNPNVGNVTTYTVSGLGSGTYWFWVRAGNGCMPGDFVGPISPGTITGVAGAPAVAPGFLPGVLGEATPSGELSGVLVTEGGEVAGIAGEGKSRIWLLSLAGLGLVVFFLKWLQKHRRMN